MTAIRSTEGHLPWIARAERREVVAKDDVPLAYEVLGQGDDAIVLANGLGGRLYTWEALVEALAPRYRIITWDYRGLFDSGMPERLHHLGIPFHARDLLAVLDAEGIQRASVIGWSMGVQVALEFAVQFPRRAHKLILINGTHGHALQTAFQPFFRLPSLHRYLHEVLDFVARKPWAMGVIGRAARSRLHIEAIGGTLALLRRNRRIRQYYAQYQHDVFGRSFHGFLRLFQELDAHSVYHHLRDIPHETLLIAGELDPMTPAYQTREMRRKMPNTSYHNFRLGTHFVLLEYPNEVVRLVQEFLARPER